MENINKEFFIISAHVAFGPNGKDIYGPAHNVVNFLKKEKRDYGFIKHPLEGKGISTIEEFINNKVCYHYKGKFRNLPFFLQLIQEFFVTLLYVKNVKNKKNKIFIGIDPLNAFFGILFKRLGLVKLVVFYTPDYTPNRFSNFLLNYIYHLIDRFSALNSAQVWNVSSRIMKVREKQGVPSNKNFLLPNSPDFQKTPRLPIEKINKYDLIMVVGIKKTFDYRKTIEVIKEVGKKFKNIRLLIIGSGDYLDDFKKLVEKEKMTQHILFLGQKDHDSLLRILSRAGVGLALYDDALPWNFYGDSMKAREYLACGLPVIISNIPSTADDIKKGKAGVVLNKNTIKEMVNAITYLLSDKNYLKIRENAIKLAKKNDFVFIIKKLFSSLGIKA